MSQSGRDNEELRHERKYLITGHSAAEVEQIIKYNPACFKEIYSQRRINNIYFDTLSFDSYYGNVEGDTNRTKARIRWYGELFGPIGNPVLEFKIKSGLLGKKESYKLMPFKLDAGFSKQEIINAMAAPGLPKDVTDLMLSLSPTLLNSYSRKYFLSADKHFRLTIDNNLEFYRISYNQNTFLNHLRTPQNVVMELKYDSQFQEEANAVSTAFPFPMTKNSKYLQGVEGVLF